MAAEAAHAEVQAPPPPPAPGAAPPEKRALPVSNEGEEDPPPPEPKRRRPCVAALDGVPCATAAVAEASGPGSGCDASFSFHHARTGFVVALETTPKFGSFNPPAAAEPAGLDAKPDADGEGSPETDERAPASSGSGAKGDGDNNEENSRSQSVGVEAGGGQCHADENDDDPVLTVDHQ
ncbi:hypothetical protein PR202_gb04492 [Eleusine coracana subsp. coracana]|uniref:Uncharacterized protein n=1 Tax=Eleusine coracana subsp. coracana TaxID=191504 RepID=A0AAV5E2A8_ELECO|nr:hypothetical protein PR202_gb04492 [Eleusine coracana subsp. coracana]